MVLINGGIYFILLQEFATIRVRLVHPWYPVNVSTAIAVTRVKMSTSANCGRSCVITEARAWICRAASSAAIVLAVSAWEYIEAGK